MLFQIPLSWTWKELSERFQDVGKFSTMLMVERDATMHHMYIEILLWDGLPESIKIHFV